ncbi:MAG: ATP-binding cassette domain-containing protein [Eubacteriales bacterium]|nr:ATP-binding cassette domain-containing protein [Eubacteriales bacterium]
MMYELRNIDFSYGEKPVLKNFSLSLPEKGVICLFGASGLGKTTVLRLMAGLETPRAGSIEGFENKRITFIFQEDRLLPWRTAKENVALALGNAPDAEGKAVRWLGALGLENDVDRYPDEMSGGMCRRVSAARALAPESDVILADEPFTGLDEKNRIALAKLFAKKAEKELVVIVTHSEEEAAMLNAEAVYM